jgi:hypothetical protein
VLGLPEAAQPRDRLGFDLVDALAGESELPADLIQGALSFVVQAVAQLDHLARCQPGEHIAELVAAQVLSDSLVGLLGLVVCDELAELCILGPRGVSRLIGCWATFTV